MGPEDPAGPAWQLPISGWRGYAALRLARLRGLLHREALIDH